jgi:uroporphyrinogen-III decarboxylase
VKHDWGASVERLATTMLGGVPDRVPLTFLASEDIAARISGLTVREMMRSPEKLAEISIETCEVLGADAASVVVTPYCGPYEGLAFAKANGMADEFEWKDYTAPFIREGAVCGESIDVAQLEIPDHRRVEPWPTILTATAIVAERTGVPANFAPSLTWSNIQMLRGSQAYIDVIENPEFLLALCEKIYASQWDYYEAFCSIVGKPYFVFNCQYAFNRTMLRFEDAWRFEGQFVNRFCKQAGLPLAIHNCGFDPYWHEMIDRHIEEGVDVMMVNGSHPLDLEDWVAFREKYPEIVIMGASLFVNGELENGRPGDVKERARENIERLGPFGRFILSPVCCMPWRVPLANILALREAVEEYGRHPIQGAATAG